MSRRAILLFALMSIVWGIPYLLIRVAVAEISPATLVFARTAIGTAILLPIALATSDVRVVIARWRWVALFAAVEIAGPWLLLGSAEQHVTSSLAALLIAGVPLVGTVIAMATGSRHRLGRAGLAGLLVGLAGVAAIVGVDVGTTDPRALLEIALVVVGYAAAPFILVRWLRDVPQVGVMALALAMCAVLYAPIAAGQWPAATPSPEVLLAVLVLGVVCTALAFVAWSALIGEVGPVRATVITYINPAVAAVLGVIVLDEPFTLGMAIGFALVLAGSALATRPAPRAPSTLVGPEAAEPGAVEPTAAEPGALARG